MICLGRSIGKRGGATCGRKGQKGAELAEFAVVFPLFLALLFGLIWAGRALSIYGTITRAAREGARFAAAPSCASCPVGSLPGNVPPSDTEIINVVSSSLQAASLNPASITAYTPPQAMTFCTGVAVAACNTTNKIQICRGVQLNGAAPPQQCGTVVSYAYPVPLTFSMPTAGAWVKAPQITVATSVQVAQEQ